MWQRFLQTLSYKTSWRGDKNGGEETRLYERYLATLERFERDPVPESPFLARIFVSPYLLELASMQKRVEVEYVPNQDLFFLFQLLFPYPAPCATLANRDLTVGAQVISLYTHYIQFYLTVTEYYEIPREDMEYYLYLYMHQEDHLREYRARWRKNKLFRYIAETLDRLFCMYVAVLQLLPNISQGQAGQARSDSYFPKGDVQRAKTIFFQHILARPAST